MPDTPPSAMHRGAVFLSYASQDSEAARRICDALRAVGVDVWLDQSELSGGDAWDAKIRDQINSCALFVPIVSANTNARLEGYFRREWKLAVERTHGMDEGLAFLLPVVIDDTADADARVPEKFRQTQWTRLRNAEIPASFTARVVSLLTGGPDLRGKSAGFAAAAPVGAGRPLPRSNHKTMLIVALAATVAAVAIACVAFWPKPPAPAGAAPAQPVVSAKSIAILPFVNMSDEKDNAYFADGVQEDILTGLALIGDMNVISRTSVMGYRDTTKSTQDIARELGVAYILEGSVRKAGKQVRVTGQLIDGRTGLHVWAHSYDRDLDDIFAIQSSLAKEITEALHAVITPEEAVRIAAKPTDNAEAYDLYLQGRAMYHLDASWPEKIPRARALFERAVELDPKFVAAWLDLYFVYGQLQQFNPSASNMALMTSALDTAVRLAPESPDVLYRLLDNARYKGDKALSADLRKRIVKANPKAAIDFEVEDALNKENYELASILMEKSLSLDPRNGDRLDELARFYWEIRKYDRAQAKFAAMIAVEPPSVWNSFRLALTPFFARGDKTQVEAFFSSLSPDARRNDPVAIAVQAEWYYSNGDAQRLIDLWKNSGTNWTFVIFSHNLDKIVVGYSYMALGKPELARPILIQNRDEIIAQLASAPNDAERYQDLASVEVLLGEIPAARAAAAKAVKLDADTEEEVQRALMWSGEASDRDAEVALIQKILPKKAASPWFFNVHMMAHCIQALPLQNDPRFKALVSDPANNLPAF